MIVIDIRTKACEDMCMYVLMMYKYTYVYGQGHLSYHAYMIVHAYVHVYVHLLSTNSTPYMLRRVQLDQGFIEELNKDRGHMDIVQFQITEHNQCWSTCIDKILN